MKYKSNAKYNIPVESGTVFKLEYNNIDISVHKIIGLDGLYMTSNFVCINKRQLKSISIISAIHEAQSIVKQKLDLINKNFDEVVNSAIEISR